MLHELKLYSDYFSKRWEFHYWSTPSENEVDFILARGQQRIGIEVKSSKKWNKDFNMGLKTLLDAGKIKSAYGVYLGDEKLKVDGIMVYPLKQFIDYLHSDKLFS